MVGSGGFAAGLKLNVDPTGALDGGRRTEGALDGVKDKARQTEVQLDKMGTGSERSLRRTERSAGSAAQKVGLLAAAATAAAVAFASRSAGAYNQYSQSLAEVSTLIDGTDEEMQYLDQSAKNLAATFGGTATQQVQAFYQAISAGAGNVQQANQLLETANQLAVGGVTDIITSVDALTTVTNAYRSSGLGAAEASDILFTGVRMGKTTVAELGAAMGQIVPTSAAVGIGLDEVVSAVAALTATGQSTSQAVTGIRQAMVGVIKPTAEASELAQRLGLDFSTAALESKGLAGFLADVAEKTGGSQDAMAQLFGSVEALNAVLALTGDAGIVFENSLSAMEESAGATQEAFDKVSQSLSQRLSVQFGILNGYALQLGQVILSAVVPALEFATTAIGFLADHAYEAQGIIIATAAALVINFAPAMIAATGATAALIASLITLRGVLITTGVGALVVGAGLLIGKFIELVEKTGGVGNAISLLGNVGAEVFERIGFAVGAFKARSLSAWFGIKASAYDMFQGMLDKGYQWANNMVGIAVGSKDAFIAAFQALPDALGSLMYATANAVVAGVEALINSVVQRINNFTGGIRDMLNSLPDWAKPEGGFSFGGGIDDVSLGGVENPYANSEGVAQSAVDAFTAALGQDYVGSAPQSLGNLADSFDRTSTSYENMADTLGTRATRPLRSIEELRAAIAGVGAEADNASLEDPNLPTVPELPGEVDTPAFEIPDTGGTTGGDGASAARDQRTAVDELSDAYENLRSSIDPVYARTQEYAQAQQVVKQALDAGIISQQEYAETMRQLNEEYKDLNETQIAGAEKAAQFFTSIVTGAKTAKQAVSDLAAKMADKLLNQGFELLIGGLFGGGGGGFLDFLFNANGNAFNAGNVMAFANGGVVDRATPFGMSNGGLGVMGEAGPEAILPLSRGNDGKLGVKSGAGGKVSNYNVNVNYSIDARGTNNEAVDNLRRDQERDRARLKSDVISAIREAQEDRIL